MKNLRWEIFLFFLLLTLTAELGKAASANSGITPDFFIDTQYAFTTSKSKLVLSNDTGTALRYGIGTYAGSNSNLAFMLHIDHDATSFALNSSKIDMTWQDTRVRYHLGMFYLGVLFSQLKMKADLAGVAFIDAEGSGIGGNTGVLYGLGRGGSLYLDIQTASISEMKNTKTQTLSVKQRLDIDMGGSIDLTAKLLDLTFGYKIRQLTIQTDSSYQEALYATYVGIRMAFAF